MESPGKLAPAHHWSLGRNQGESIHLGTPGDKASFTWKWKQSLHLIFLCQEGEKFKEQKSTADSCGSSIMPLPLPKDVHVLINQNLWMCSLTWQADRKVANGNKSCSQLTWNRNTILAYSGGPNVITKIFKRWKREAWVSASQWWDMRTQPAIVGFEDERAPWVKRCGWPIEARKGKIEERVTSRDSRKNAALPTHWF